MICPHCQRENFDKSSKCGWCGESMKSAKTNKPSSSPSQNSEQSRSFESTPNGFSSQPKSKLAAGLLGIFLGGLGIHNFYLGYISRGVTQLLLSTIGSIVLLGPLIAGIWGFVEGIQILTGSINTDNQGQPLVD